MKAAKKLSEAILLQGLEDLYSAQHRLDALKFFAGDDFKTCSSIIGMNTEESNKVLDIVRKSRITGKTVPVGQSTGKIRSLPKSLHRVPAKQIGREIAYHPA